ncbi:MAG: hypothetical protein A3K18_01970 [Lentisphaerae bacterium RIFOXYA12_64_32]|nr:MAG: hypothetical protein A3K18_01970 [Lentisphaerae bacterium RIFOXYA12_64_32]
MVDRMLAPRLISAQKSVLLLGPRQTGKSTLIDSLKPDLETNLARESEFLTFSANPDELEQRISGRQPLPATSARRSTPSARAAVSRSTSSCRWPA